MKILINLFKLHLRIIYFFLKMLKTDDKKILLMSRQYKTNSIDYNLIEEDIHKRYKDYKLVILNKMLDRNIKSIVSYAFHIYKQMYHLATSKVCLIDTYIIPVSVLKHKPDLVVIQLCHGIGNIKKFGYQTLKNESGKGEKLSLLMDMHKNYDYCVSTSKATSKFYSEAFNMNKSQMLEFGPPRIDYILNVPNKKEDVLKEYPDLKDKPVILYVSTFRTYEDDYLENFAKYADTTKYNIIIHIHPVAYKHHADIDKCIDERFYRCSIFPTAELLSVADIVITDYSSFLFESTLLNIPTYLYTPDYDKYVSKNGLNVDLKKELSKVIYFDAIELFKGIDIENYDIKTLEKFKNKYIKNTKGNSTQKLVDFMIEKTHE